MMQQSDKKICDISLKKQRFMAPQSRQSAKLFSSRRNWDYPMGGGHTRWRERGWESPYSDEGTYTVVLFIYMYFVDGTVPLSPSSFEFAFIDHVCTLQ